MKNVHATIPPELAGLRLDQALPALWPEVTRSRAARLLRDGHLTVDGQPARPAATARAGQEIAGDIPEAEPTTAVAQDIDLDIVHEDDDLLVVNKRAGMVVHPAAGNPDGTLVNALLHHLPGLADLDDEESGAARPGIVHRLDKGTSGLLVVAKNTAARLALQQQFAGRTIEKIYLALVLGRPPAAEGRIDLAIGRHVRDRKRHSATTASPRPATTLWRLLAHRAGVSALECRLLTGRTHQIRVHCAESGWPLVADETYGGVRPLKRLPDPAIRAACLALDRPALHARFLAFEHPRGGRVEFAAPIPADLQAILDLLEKTNA